MLQTYKWAFNTVKGLPNIAVMPCKHDLGKFIGDGKLQCCECGTIYDPPRS